MQHALSDILLLAACVPHMISMHHVQCNDLSCVYKLLQLFINSQASEYAAFSGRSCF